ncbi:MAG TPA: aminotransferase class V-fold PLP-dependent enzyme [Nannocystaceae bacterium]|nr:aminotransferase class V-fold PLP-dependent enzyme [Nannocystaceae bacterium]
MHLRDAWTLDPAITFLNHGSFGACPRVVLDAQAELRREIEREPVDFFIRRLGPRLDAARDEVAAFLGADPQDLVFVRNATSGVAAVVGSLALEPGDELLATDHGYNACQNALDRVAARAGARVVVARLPFPVTDPAEVTGAILRAVTPRTRLALVDHVTSPTGLVLPVADIVRALRERGVDTLVDGAHAPGMLDLHLDRLGAAYYTGNFHKWVCAPKGAAMLWVRRDRHAHLHPAVISHGYNSRRPRPRFHEEFDWTGTDDPTPWLTVPLALRTVAAMLPGGWPEVRARCHALALRGRQILADALHVAPPAPASMIGTLAALELPPGPLTQSYALDVLPLQQALFDRHAIEVPIVPWPRPPARLVRISAFLHNHEDEYRRLADALRVELAREAEPA